MRRVGPRGPAFERGLLEGLRSNGARERVRGGREALRVERPEVQEVLAKDREFTTCLAGQFANLKAQFGDE
eukprot:1448092-Pyramimonas_sp.AAC.1